MLAPPSTAINEGADDFFAAVEKDTQGTAATHKKGQFTSLVLLIALGLHAAFEGMAVGLLGTMSSTLKLAFSILIHKFAESLSITISMQKSGMTARQIVIYSLIFASMTPLGTILGIFVNGMSELVNIVFMSLAVGTFLYVACSELIIEEFQVRDHKWLKLAAFYGGAIFILALN